MTPRKIVHRIALVNPFQIDSEGYDLEIVRNKGQLVEVPLGLAYISAYLKKYGYDEVRIFDAHMMAVKGFTKGTYANLEEVENDLMACISEFKPDLVGISCLFHYIYRTAHKIAKRLKEMDKNIITVMGGAYPTVSYEIALSDKNIDFVILGEGERAFLNLVETLNGRREWNEIKSVAYKNKSGQIEINREFDLCKSLDEITMPDRTDFILEDYYRYGRNFIQKFEELECKELKIATLTATRGCIFRCSFCINKKLWGGGLRVRDPEKVISEIEYLKKEYGINYFSFNDDNLLINKAFAHKFLRGIIDKKLNIRWVTGGMSVRGLDREIINLMVESGCLTFSIAIESGSEEILKQIHKPVELEEVYDVVSMIREHKDTYLMGLFMLGFPEETEEQFFKTIKFGKSLKCDWTLYSRVTPFPGSELYYEAKGKGMLPPNIEDDFEKLSFRNYIMTPAYLANEFVNRESYFANLDQNFFENPNLFDGRESVALSDFKNVIKHTPSHATAYYCIGRIYDQKGDKVAAKHFYEKASQNLSGLQEEFFQRKRIEIPRN